MTEEKDFWINKNEVSALSNAEGTVYKVTQETMNREGWYKLADDEQVVKKAELTKEEAEFVEKNNALEFLTSNLERSFSTTAITYALKQSNKSDVYTRLIQSYFNGYIVEKEPKYYIKLEFNRSDVSYLNINEFGVWFLSSKHELADAKTQFTQTEIDKMQKDPRAKGLDLNVLKVEVPADELED